MNKKTVIMPKQKTKKQDALSKQTEDQEKRDTTAPAKVPGKDVADSNAK